MPTTLRLRFLKKGRYDAFTFIASKKREPEAYGVLVAFAKRLEALAPDQYRNPYHDPSKGYTTVSFKKYGHEAALAKYNKGDTVEVCFGIGKTVKGEQTYYNPVLTSLKRLKVYQAPDQDLLDTSSWLPATGGKEEKKEQELPSIEKRLAALAALNAQND